MSIENIKTAYDIMNADELAFIDSLGVSPADIEAADRLIADVAEKDDAEVDYEAMLRRIKAAAMEQGLAAKLNAGKKKARTRRILRWAASAAAVLVAGLGVLGMVKMMEGARKGAYDGMGDTAAYNEPEATEAVSATEDVKSVPTAGPAVTEAAVTPVPTAEPAAPTEVNVFVPASPLPPEIPIRGGVRGYTYIEGFTAPFTSGGLYFDRLPDYMSVEPYEGYLGYIARGVDEEGCFRYIDCHLADASSSDLEPGVAIYTIKDHGGISFVWRIDEDYCMYIDFDGFTYSEAEAILLSYTMDDIIIDK